MVFSSTTGNRLPIRWFDAKNAGRREPGKEKNDDRIGGSEKGWSFELAEGRPKEKTACSFTACQDERAKVKVIASMRSTPQAFVYILSSLYTTSVRWWNIRKIQERRSDRSMETADEDIAGVRVCVTVRIPKNVSAEFAKLRLPPYSNFFSIRYKYIS